MMRIVWATITAYPIRGASMDSSQELNDEIISCMAVQMALYLGDEQNAD
jgi:hypothetical protein